MADFYVWVRVEGIEVYITVALTCTFSLTNKIGHLLICLLTIRIVSFWFMGRVLCILYSGLSLVLDIENVF